MNRKALTGLVGLFLMIGAAACGSSPTSGNASSQSASTQRTLSAHDRASLRRINDLVSSFRKLEGKIAADTIAGSKIHSRSQYVRDDKPRIDKLSRTTQQVRLAVGSLDDTHLAALYTPLAEALDREAGHFQLFLNTLVQGSVSALPKIYKQLGQDEQHINNVVLEQLPKVRAYSRRYAG